MSSPMFDLIVEQGNRGTDYHPTRDNWITCADGFKLSVLAGNGAYCTPRPDPFATGWDGPLADPIRMYQVGADYPGPYTAVEVGYPSERPEPWHCTAWNDGYDSHSDHDVCDGWAVLADGDHDGKSTDYETVFGFVPVEKVRALIEAHGGEA